MGIIELKEEEAGLIDLLNKNRAKQKELNRIDFIEKYGIDLGDEIEWQYGFEIKKGIISNIEFAGVNPKYFKVINFNKNGEIGKKEVRIWPQEQKSVKLIKKYKLK